MTKNVTLITNYLARKVHNNKICMTKKIALIGLGPHAKRIYLNYFKKHNVELSLVVDLESKRSEIKQYLLEQGFKRTNIFSVNDKYKDNEHLNKETETKLLAVCNTLEISHIIIATEPKAHNMYVEFALKNNIHVLTDKPITVTKKMTSISSINKVRKQYYDLLELSSTSSAMCKVMCQRQYHRGYEYIKKILNEVVKKYQVPITYIDIYHCDGNWEMPHDMLKENHPYKYGYGKLFHSGYHFIDLLSDFIKINNQLPSNKKIVKGDIYSNCFTPNDELNVFNIDDYHRIFEKQNIPHYYHENQNPKFDKFGEKNFYGMLEFRNKYNRIITNVNLNLLHYGFSRRGWIESKDYYKKNGRIRHERINIQVGTIMNIQVHSYQSKEIKDRLDNFDAEEVAGGLEHFDIDIYRNVDIIGGKPFERIKLGDLYSEKEKQNILGYNELSREVYLNNFLKGKCEKGDIKDQALGIEILHGCALGIHNYYKNKKSVEKIDVKNKYINPLTPEDLRVYSIKNYLNVEKDLLEVYETNQDDISYNVLMNYIPKHKVYETYIFVGNKKLYAGGILSKLFKTKICAYFYYYYLVVIAKSKSIKFIKLLASIQNKHKKRKK